MQNTYLPTFYNLDIIRTYNGRLDLTLHPVSCVEKKCVRANPGKIAKLKSLNNPLNEKLLTYDILPSRILMEIAEKESVTM